MTGSRRNLLLSVVYYVTWPDPELWEVDIPVVYLFGAAVPGNHNKKFLTLKWWNNHVLYSVPQENKPKKPQQHPPNNNNKKPPPKLKPQQKGKKKLK